MDPPPSPRVKPQECLTPTEVGRCQVPADFDDATLTEQAAMLLPCAIENGAAAREAERKRACLAEWIAEEP